MVFPRLIHICSDDLHSKSRPLGRRTRPGSVRSLLRRLHLAASAFLEDFWIELCINFVFEPAFRTVKPWERFLYLAHPITFVRALAKPPPRPFSSLLRRALHSSNEHWQGRQLRRRAFRYRI